MLSATVSDLQIQLSTYRMHTTSEATTQTIVCTTAELTANFVADRIRQTATNTNQAKNLSIYSIATTMSAIKEIKHVVQSSDQQDLYQDIFINVLNM